jgi:hypothetical protein
MQALHEALIRQEELLAYVDRKTIAKAQVCHFSVLDPFSCCLILSLLFSFLGQFLMSTFLCAEKEEDDVLLLGPGERPHPLLSFLPSEMPERQRWRLR